MVKLREIAAAVLAFAALVACTSDGSDPTSPPAAADSPAPADPMTPTPLAPQPGLTAVGAFTLDGDELDANLTYLQTGNTATAEAVISGLGPEHRDREFAIDLVKAGRVVLEGAQYYVTEGSETLNVTAGAPVEIDPAGGAIAAVLSTGRVTNPRTAPSDLLSAYPPEPAVELQPTATVTTRHLEREPLALASFGTR